MHVDIANSRLGPSYVRVHNSDAHNVEMILARINVAALTKLRDDLRADLGSIPDHMLDDGHCWAQATFPFYETLDEPSLRVKWIAMIEEMIEGFEFILQRRARYYGASTLEFQIAEERALAGRMLYAEHFLDLYI